MDKRRKIMILYGTKKSAILLMSIGVDRAARVLNQLTVQEINKIVKYMVCISYMSSQERSEIILEFHDFIDPMNRFIFFDKNDIFLMLKKAFGQANANIFLENMIEMNDIQSMMKQFDTMQTNELFHLINNEHLQIIAIIIIHLSSYQAAQILEYFSEKQRFEIMLRIATFKGIQTSGKIEFVYAIENILNRYQNLLNNRKGIKVIAKVLNLMNINYERNIIHKFSEYSKNLTRRILNEMILFKNIVNIDDKYIVWLVQHVNLDVVCIALSDNNDLLKKKFIKNMSKNDVIYMNKYFLKQKILSISKINSAQNYILKKIKFILDKEMLVINNRKEKCLI